MHIFSLWQQAGRAGRRERPSLAVYVAFDGPLDQYFMNHPRKLFGSPIECCHIDAQNRQVLNFPSLLLYLLIYVSRSDKLAELMLIFLVAFYSMKVLEQHLVCAAHEYPLSFLYDEKYFGSGLSSAVLSLKTRGYLSSDQSFDSYAEVWNYIGQEVCYLFCGLFYMIPLVTLISTLL